MHDSIFHALFTNHTYGGNLECRPFLALSAAISYILTPVPRIYQRRALIHHCVGFTINKGL